MSFIFFTTLLLHNNVLWLMILIIRETRKSLHLVFVCGRDLKDGAALVVWKIFLLLLLGRGFGVLEDTNW